MKEIVTSVLTLEEVWEFASANYAGREDKSEHLRFVSELVQGSEAKIAGVLHDIIEDTNVTPEDLRKLGCSDQVIEAITLLTHPKDYVDTEEEYLKQIKKIAASGNQIAIDVKWADLTHNSNPEGYKKVTPKVLTRIPRYLKAKEILRPVISGYLS